MHQDIFNGFCQRKLKMEQCFWKILGCPNRYLFCKAKYFQVSNFFHAPIFLLEQPLTQSPSQSAPTILNNRAPCFLKIGHPAFWKKQSAKNQGHCNSKREEAAWSLLFLNKECPCFFQPAFFQKAGCPIFKNSGCRLTGRVNNSILCSEIIGSVSRVSY